MELLTDGTGFRIGVPRAVLIASASQSAGVVCPDGDDQVGTGRGTPYTDPCSDWADNHTWPSAA